MKRTLGIFVITVAMVLGAYQLGEHAVRADIPTTIPASYGHCKGASHIKGADALIFEADDGTVRLLNLENGSSVTFTRN